MLDTNDELAAVGKIEIIQSNLEYERIAVGRGEILKANLHYLLKG